MGQRRKPAVISDVKVESPGLNLTYPKVSELKHKSAEAGINRYIKKEVHRILKENGYGSDENKKFTGGYLVKLNKRGTLCIIMEIFIHIKGEARGTTIRRPINVSLKDSRVYHIDDLFSRRIKKYKFIGIINEFIKQHIKMKNINLTKEFEGIKSDQDYYLTEDSLVIFFEMGEYTAVEFGFPEVTIEFSSILDIVNNKGPIGRLLRDNDDSINEETADE
ncbi:RsiV family protein [Candidatus Clostridium radicumherbarum]|uniref:RsiV family protein n=1 Tax=Candidatus Clostridium radicumherbarum TaxID=3381662 RepID=A0ABW8TNK6_9CLOT